MPERPQKSFVCLAGRAQGNSSENLPPYQYGVKGSYLALTEQHPSMYILTMSIKAERESVSAPLYLASQFSVSPMFCIVE